MAMASSPGEPLESSERLDRAVTSLEGLSVGDAFGERFFIDPAQVQDRVEARSLLEPPWRYTDDTLMALSVVSNLRQHGQIEQKTLARNFGEKYDNTRGYGPAMHDLLARLWVGVPHEKAARSLFNGQGSFGNGAAMRVAPVGAYFADDLDAAVENARLSADVTHSHPEAIAGAIAVAVAAAWAWRLQASGSLLGRQDFIDLVLPSIPDSEIKAGVQRARDLPGDATVEAAVGALGNGTGVSAQDTVPFTLWCAGGCLGSYEEALWLTVSGLGDRDTTCAIVGGIVVMYSGIHSIPAPWRAAREPLPDWPFRE